MTLDDIKEWIKQYNATLPIGSRRWIVESHAFYCRCMTCWYDHDGPKRHEEWGTSDHPKKPLPV